MHLQLKMGANRKAELVLSIELVFLERSWGCFNGSLLEPGLLWSQHLADIGDIKA